MTGSKTAGSPIQAQTSPRQDLPTGAAGVKRKRVPDTKYYGVREGRIPGVYATWAECLHQVKGHKNALFQAFPTRAAAQAFVSGQPTDNSNGTTVTTGSNKPTKYYAVRVGRVPGIYTDWPSAQAQIVGWKQPKHRRFDSRAEAESFMMAPTVPNGLMNGASDEVRVLKGGEGLVMGEQTELLDGPGAWPLPSGAVDGFDPNVQLEADGKLRYKTLEEKKRRKTVPTFGSASVLKIYTDGSSLNNGQGGAVGGVGVYFGPGHKSNISEPLPGPRQTNQRAELTALLRALEVAPLHRPVEIYTDSRYAIGCITQWYDNWVRKGWVTAKGHKVENKDLIVEIKKMVDERKDSFGVDTVFVWVKGHAGSEGNQMADKLAVAGANGVGGRMGGGAKWEDDEDENGSDEDEIGEQQQPSAKSEEIAADVTGDADEISTIDYGDDAGTDIDMMAEMSKLADEAAAGAKLLAKKDNRRTRKGKTTGSHTMVVEDLEEDV
ncbi:putative rnase h domain protein [Phaeomoniella chlamydospora]|uniref:Ribonuclease H n=1 Tax=Phaeomoniella chlamydospora TaxID=158046 RepID=A0A0G2GNB6_PHACM|nr:putative rnase h domain protein [Phaeomoniella chlamydospora]